MRPFILPGDAFTADEETPHFHKGRRYKVQRVFQYKGHCVHTILDKNGVEVPMSACKFTDYDYEEWRRRAMRARLDFFWDDAEIMTIGRWLYDFDDAWFYELAGSRFGHIDLLLKKHCNILKKAQLGSP